MKTKRELKIINLDAITTSNQLEIDGVCCVPVAQPSLAASQIDHAATVFAALADTTRLTIVHLLAQSEGEVCVCDITASFKLGQPTISHHLKILREAGLISGVKRGKWVYYSLVENQISEVKAALDLIVRVPVPTLV